MKFDMHRVVSAVLTRRAFPDFVTDELLLTDSDGLQFTLQMFSTDGVDISAPIIEDTHLNRWRKEATIQDTADSVQASAIAENNSMQIPMAS